MVVQKLIHRARFYIILSKKIFYPVNDDSPTHYDTYSDKFDVLDFIFVSNNILHQLSNYYTDDNLGSDHFSMFAIFGKVNKDKTPSIKNIKLYHKTNWEHFNEHLTKNYHDYSSNNQPNLNDINMITKQIDNTSEWLTNNIKIMSDQLIPTTTIKKNSTPLSINIRQKIKEKRKLRRLWLKTRDKTYKQHLNKIQNEIKRDIIKTKKDQWENMCNNINTNEQTSWKSIKKDTIY